MMDILLSFISVQPLSIKREKSDLFLKTAVILISKAKTSKFNYFYDL